MDVVVLSKILILLFVGSVTFWYMVTPYLVQPHPGIVNDILTKTQLEQLSDGKLSASQVEVENWTKWRIFVNSSSGKTEDRQVVYGHSISKISLEEGQTIMSMEWRSDYHISVSKPSNGKVSAELIYPPGSLGAGRGIYDHFTVTQEKNRIKITPRFLFGIHPDIIESMYGTDVADFPVIGVFTNSPKFDRILIQAYMNVVILSVIFLLYANNPPDSIGAKKVN